MTVPLDAAHLQVDDPVDTSDPDLYPRDALLDQWYNLLLLLSSFLLLLLVLGVSFVLLLVDLRTGRGVGGLKLYY